MSTGPLPRQTVSLSATRLQTAGSVEVFVTSPVPRGGHSSAARFQVVSPSP